MAEKIDDARDEVMSEVKELRSDLRDDLKERLIRMEAGYLTGKSKVRALRSSVLRFSVNPIPKNSARTPSGSSAPAWPIAAPPCATALQAS